MKQSVDLDGMVSLPSGKISLRQVNALFTTLPYELDFIDADDNYQWYSPNPWRDDKRLT